MASMSIKTFHIKALYNIYTKGRKTDNIMRNKGNIEQKYAPKN